ncbi:hypothetical protein KB20921_16990 [Edwardsiella ictaluri]|nr:Uncharacterised protein [Edwardsiella ictaluri]BEH98943.1 hypothetical protein KH20906_16710 [Edwardsiella ictaluri]BEI02438.1 hypothetical protein KB20921_16990 [Edwardsiella ictaluri]BEI12840.1 hypothetical protein STU22816_16930 [Edwardsiella ictaluri]BEI16318.1 hypothetical protein STA22820_16910 [Edwardsiella ictaluri]
MRPQIIECYIFKGMTTARQKSRAVYSVAHSGQAKTRICWVLQLTVVTNVIKCPI